MQPAVRLYRSSEELLCLTADAELSGLLSPGSGRPAEADAVVLTALETRSPQRIRITVSKPVVGVVAPAVQVRGTLDLGHHVPGDRAAKPLAELGVVLGVEDRGGGQRAAVPAVPAGVPGKTRSAPRCAPGSCSGRGWPTGRPGSVPAASGRWLPDHRLGHGPPGRRRISGSPGCRARPGCAMVVMSGPSGHSA